MVQNGLMAQMADGIHVLGLSMEQLASNYIEVLKRAENCGSKFKAFKSDCVSTEYQTLRMGIKRSCMVLKHHLKQ